MKNTRKNSQKKEAPINSNPEPVLSKEQKEAKEQEKSLLIARIAYETCDDKKAWQPIVLDVSECTSLCTYMVIVSQAVRAQVRGLAKSIERALEDEEIEADGREGLKAGEWILLDYGDVLINVLHQPERDFYRLEEIWRKAPKVEF
ncbi:MAG: ribosome silencing factor [Candidatus Caenarcaniphilales bacterium]|nr:ribosome silencing factor [Candidatus Caenarcaniphilales bacterium]